jgi:hypothetical protein
MVDAEQAEAGAEHCGGAVSSTSTDVLHYPLAWGAFGAKRKPYHGGCAGKDVKLITAGCQHHPSRKRAGIKRETVR